MSVNLKLQLRFNGIFSSLTVNQGSSLPEDVDDLYWVVCIWAICSPSKPKAFAKDDMFLTIR